MMDAIYLNALGLLCTLGNDVASVRAALFDVRAPSVAISAFLPGKSVPVGEVQAQLADVEHLPLPLRSRNNALVLSALAQIRADVDAAMARYGAHRVAVVLGTSTSGIAEAERAVAEHARDGQIPAEFDIGQQEMGSPALALRAVLGCSGPAYVISTACSSSAKAIASAGRLLRAGLADAVVAGGAHDHVDQLIACTHLRHGNAGQHRMEESRKFL